MKNNKFTSKDVLLFLSLLYGAISFAMNVFCMKPLSYGTNVVFSDGGQVISWGVFLIANVIVEVWGEETSMKIISFSAITTFTLLLIGRLLTFIPSAIGYEEQTKAFSLIFSNGPRTITSSLIAFWVGGRINVKIIALLKGKQKKEDNRVAFFFRASASTLVGQLVDNALFMILSFAPIGLSLYEMAWKDILSAIIIGTIFELVVESCMVPFITIPLTKKLQKMKEEEEK